MRLTQEQRQRRAPKYRELADRRSGWAPFAAEGEKARFERTRTQPRREAA